MTSERTTAPGRTTTTGGRRRGISGRRIGLVLGPVLFLVVELGPELGSMGGDAQHVLAATLWIATWWVTEAIPLAATALLPVILLPLLGVTSYDDVVTRYADDIILLFLGGFVIAAALEKVNLHRRIALSIINVLGTNPSRLVLGFILSTTFVSLWISNTATAMMMVPIAMSILSQFTFDAVDDRKRRNLERALLFATAYGATAGGMGTLISGTPNPIFAAQSREMFDTEIGFGQFMLFGTPVAFLFALIIWLFLTRVAFRLDRREIPGAKEVVRRELAGLGPMARDERLVLAVITCVALLWITRSFFLVELLPEISDGMISIAGLVALFLLPAARDDDESRAATRSRILTWQDTRKVPWDVLILFGGGLAIASGFEVSGLSEWVGEQLGVLEGVPTAVVVFAGASLVLLLTEITSNTATATLIVPVFGVVGNSIGIDPVTLMMAAALGANFAFMLPVATPPNAIIYGTGKITIGEMVRVGFALNLVSAVVVTVVLLTWFPVVF
ncbi:SLC13 family permease [Georgenia alba]|uniref:Sodium-dependent dicarboxylate transporter SdcS n=1 Tax=Georgenia alba TaxID=2233858 RepID=A0ABW2QB27_9MICO